MAYIRVVFSVGNFCSWNNATLHIGSSKKKGLQVQSPKVFFHTLIPFLRNSIIKKSWKKTKQSPLFHISVLKVDITIVFQIFYLQKKCPIFSILPLPLFGFVQFCLRNFVAFSEYMNFTVREICG